MPDDIFQYWQISSVKNYYANSFKNVVMGKKSDLTKEEKMIIVQELEKFSSTLEIAKKLKRDHRNIMRFCKDGSNE